MVNPMTASELLYSSKQEAQLLNISLYEFRHLLSLTGITGTWVEKLPSTKKTDSFYYVESPYYTKKNIEQLKKTKMYLSNPNSKTGLNGHQIKRINASLLSQQIQ